MGGAHTAYEITNHQILGEKEREREIERERERDTDRQTDRQTKRQTKRQTENLLVLVYFQKK